MTAPIPILIVGEANPYGADPRYALYHHPRGASGDRLRCHLGLRDTTYARMKKVNLCPMDWSWDVARRAAKVVELEFPTYPLVLLLGARVKDAFEGPRFFSYQWRGENADARTALVALPHPSGRNPMWNEPGARARARELLSTIAPFVPWGEAD